jgi:predicted dehydrogenase
MRESLGRRTFLKRAAGAGIAAQAASSLGAVRGPGAPSEKVVLAIMGTNSRGAALARGFARLESADVAYICDVDERAIAKGVGVVDQVCGKPPKGLRDFRRALEDKSVDALVIAAPDHWHAPAGILACSAGKHVYVEKPCSHNPREGELLVAAARKHRRVVQMGSQRRSWPKLIEAVERVKSGAIGRAYYARGWYANNRASIGRGKEAPAPSWLDYELWQGPAPRRAYRDNLIHYNWHWFWNWGTGESGNNGIHSLDLCRWALGVDFPTRVSSTGGRYHYRDDWETPDTQLMSFEFEGGKAMSWEGLSSNPFGLDGSGYGCTIHGETGTILIGGSNGYVVYDAKGKEVERVSPKSGEQKIDVTGPAANLDAVHFDNFLAAIREGTRPNAEIEEAHKSTLLIHLGNIALRTGRALRCDPKNGHILEDPQAAALWGREYEKGWEPKV